MFRAMDPSWTLEGFQKELREYIIPEVVDAYLSADQEALKSWCGEAVSDGYLFPASAGGRLMGHRRTMSYGLRWRRTSAKD